MLDANVMLVSGVAFLILFFFPLFIADNLLDLSKIVILKRDLGKKKRQVVLQVIICTF